MTNSTNNPEKKAGEAKAAAIVTEIEICGCTNEALERGDTCGQANCPNLNLSEEERDLRRREFSMEGVY